MILEDLMAALLGDLLTDYISHVIGRSYMIFFYLTCVNL